MQLIAKKIKYSTTAFEEATQTKQQNQRGKKKPKLLDFFSSWSHTKSSLEKTTTKKFEAASSSSTI
jgi:hypothetical protein